LAPGPVGGLGRVLILCIQHDRGTSFAQDDHFGIGRFSNLELRLDALVLELAVGEALADDALIIGDTLGFHAFALCFLLFFLQHVFHFLCILFCGHFLFDAGLYCLGEADVTDEQLFEEQAAFLKFPGDGFEDPPLEFVAFAGVQGYGIVIDGVVSYPGAGQRPDDFVGIVQSCLADDPRGVNGKYLVQDGEIDDYFEPVGREHADGIVSFFGSFVFDRAHRIILGFYIHFLHFHQGVDKMKSAIQNIVLDPSIEDLYTDFAGADLDDGSGEQADDR